MCRKNEYKTRRINHDARIRVYARRNPINPCRDSLFTVRSSGLTKKRYTVQLNYSLTATDNRLMIYKKKTLFFYCKYLFLY